MTASDFLRKFLSRDDVEAALDEVAASASKSGQRVALAGGIAMQFYGSDRLTKDVDVLCREPLPGMTQVGVLSFGGWKLLDSRGTAVDVISRSDEYSDLYDSALDDAVRISGMDIYIVKVEYLIVMKMQAGRRKDEDDIVAVLKADAVDVKAAKQLIRKFLGRGLEKDLDGYLQEAEWRRQEDK